MRGVLVVCLMLFLYAIGHIIVEPGVLGANCCFPLWALWAASLLSLTSLLWFFGAIQEVVSSDEERAQPKEDLAEEEPGRGFSGVSPEFTWQ